MWQVTSEHKLPHNPNWSPLPTEKNISRAAFIVLRDENMMRNHFEKFFGESSKRAREGISLEDRLQDWTHKRESLNQKTMQALEELKIEEEKYLEIAGMNYYESIAYIAEKKKEEKASKIKDIKFTRGEKLLYLALFVSIFVIPMIVGISLHFINASIL